MKKFGLVFLLLIYAFVYSQSLHIAHWNDFHSANIPYIMSYNGCKKLVGGYAYLAGIVDSLRGIYHDLIVLDAGDEFLGSPISSIIKGYSQFIILNMLLPTAFCIGNHEFDYGVSNLVENIKKAKFDIITSNIKYKGKYLGLPLKRMVIDGVKVCIIGIIYDNLESSTLPENIRGVEILNPTKVVKSIVDSLKEDVDIFILLSHWGVDNDKNIANEIGDLDIIIGGHSHTVLNTPITIGNTIICQAGSKGSFVGFLEADVDTIKNVIKKFTYELIDVYPEEIKPNELVKNIVDSLENTVSQEMNKVIGILKTPWERRFNGESNIGNWITDVMRKKFKTDIALQNSGGIRKNMPAGEIRVRDIWEIVPFENEVVIIKVTGKQLLNIFMHYPENKMDLLQISGAKLKINMNTGRLYYVRVNGKKIRRKRNYTIATNSYVASHAERFLGIMAEDLHVIRTGVLLRDLLIEEIKKEKEVYSYVNGRIIIVER
ncbi:MAG: bifunctional metallophosphatase/5'-nucleotidase [Candidatus Marinimicrobia bacterium]|nr:bifunctional metallophosphatase/5'-nucleotidase [Candidatus Neomarinimicrobiota bacterium]